MTYSKGVVEVQDFVPFTCKGTRSLAVTNLVSATDLAPNASIPSRVVPVWHTRVVCQLPLPISTNLVTDNGKVVFVWLRLLETVSNHLVPLHQTYPLSVTTKLGINNSLRHRLVKPSDSLLIPTLFCSHTHRDLPSLCLSCLGQGKDVPPQQDYGVLPPNGSRVGRSERKGVPTSGLCLVWTEPFWYPPNGLPAEPEVAVAKIAPLGVVVARWLSGVIPSPKDEGIATEYRSLMVSLSAWEQTHGRAKRESLSVHQRSRAIDGVCTGLSLLSPRSQSRLGVTKND